MVGQFGLSRSSEDRLYRFAFETLSDVSFFNRICHDLHRSSINPQRVVNVAIVVAVANALTAGQQHTPLDTFLLE